MTILDRVVTFAEKRPLASVTPDRSNVSVVDVIRVSLTVCPAMGAPAVSSRVMTTVTIARAAHTVGAEIRRVVVAGTEGLVSSANADVAKVPNSTIANAHESRSFDDGVRMIPP